MWLKWSKLLVLIIFASLFTECSKNKAGSEKLQTVPLHQCSVKSPTPYICFDSLLTDSRCPTGLVCVWSGTALIKVTFNEPAASHTFVMSLKGSPSLNFASDTIINGYKIEFVKLDPYPSVINNGNPQAEKQASFTITR